MILGVCEWLSTKIGVEAKNIRIFFVLTLLLAGFGIGLYLVLLLVKVLSK
jgi:phage shock protein PspC (stress-responsive transcriptional regulator)